MLTFSNPETTGFIQTYGALILAVYAIVQVWAIAIWKKFIWKGKVIIFETGGIEIGFGHGPLFTLTGTFKAERKVVFIHRVKIVITREDDRKEFKLDWLAFKGPLIKVGDPTATPLEVASGINIHVEQPIRYSIVFCDKTTQNIISRKLFPISVEWKTFLQKNQGNIERDVRNKRAQDIVAEEYFTKFIETSEEVKNFFDFHESINWLQSGSYRIKMEAKVSDPKKSFFKEWQFLLDEELCRAFRANSEATLREMCLGTLNYFIATVDYLDSKPPSINDM